MKKIFPFIIFLTPLVFFHKAFTNFFAGDDFFVLKMSKANSLKDFLLFFSPKETYGDLFFRPLTDKLYPFFLQSLFGLNPLVFHAFTFIFFFLNVFLCFKIIKLLTKSEKVALLSSFLYSFNASNFLSLYWATLFEQILMTTFFFLTIYLFLKKNNLALITFIFALLSREGAIILPFTLLLIVTLFPQKKQKTLFPFFITLFLYLLSRLGLGNLPFEKNYTFSLALLNNIFWYILWALGLPEMLLDFIGPGLKLNLNFLNWYWQYGLIFLTSLSILIPWFILKLTVIFKRKPKETRLIVFFISWFVLTLVPVLFFPWHKFTYYLTVPLLGPVGLLSTLLVKTSKTPRLIIITTLLILSFTSVKLSEKTHWVIKRGKIAHSLIKKAQEKYPYLPRGANLYVANDPNYPFISKEWGGSSNQAHHALSGESAFQVFYNDYTLKVYFEDINPPPPGQESLTIKAVIPD